MSGVGVFYYEGPEADDIPKPRPKSKKKRADGALFLISGQN